MKDDEGSTRGRAARDFVGRLPAIRAGCYGLPHQWSGAAMHRRSWWWVLGAGVVAVLAGCGPLAGTDRADKALLATDIYGCPDLSGTYVFPPPGEKGVSYAGSLLEQYTIEGGRRLNAAQIQGVMIRRFKPGAFEFRFVVADEQVRQQLATIREYEKPRYREWYHLAREPGRSASIARDGAERHANRLRELGPITEVVREVRAVTDAKCRDGWLELPRQYTDRPIRLTLGEDGSILGESRELTTYDIAVWCGDGCSYLKIPTGTYTASLQWPRDDALRPWRTEDGAARFAIERPIDDIQAEQQARAEMQRRSDAKQFLSANAIRARLEAMAPAGTVVDEVEIADGKVHIRYTAPTAEMDILLDRVEAAGGISVTHAPQEVQRIVTSRQYHVRSVEFVLTESPLVLRTTKASAPPFVGDADASTSDASASAMLTLSAAESRPSAEAARGTSPPAASVAAQAAQTVPAGMADPATIRRRIAPLFGTGCRIVDVGYGGDLVRLTGHAEQHRCVSEGLRALDGVGSRPELQSIESDARNRYVFRISIQASSLTRR
jgi:hypothetical protein